ARLIDDGRRERMRFADVEGARCVGHVRTEIRQRRADEYQRWPDLGQRRRAIPRRDDVFAAAECFINAEAPREGIGAVRSRIALGYESVGRLCKWSGRSANRAEEGLRSRIGDRSSLRRSQNGRDAGAARATHFVSFIMAKNK